MIPMLFSEVRMSSVADTPVLLLREAAGSRQLPIWISAAGGHAILSALEAVTEEHPAIHDVMLDALSVMDAVVDEVRITAVVDGVFSAELSVAGNTVPCKASDGIALALRGGAPILVAEEVLEAAGIDLVAATPEASLLGGDSAEMEEFRAFLDTITPEDFSGTEDGGAQP